MSWFTWLITVAAAISTLCKTLVVEDDHASCTAIVRMLQRSGFEVDCALTLFDAFVKLDRDPECVVLDLMLPDGNGVDVLRKIRTENMPMRVAVVTAMVDPAILREVQRLGPDVFFPKPLDFVELRDWLTALQ